MENKLNEICVREADILQRLKLSSRIVISSIARLKKFVAGYNFIVAGDEINFFKNIKPKFSSKLIFYQKAYEILLYLPIAPAPDITIYYSKELQKIGTCFSENKELLSYFRSNSTVLMKYIF